ncbi:MAG: type 1 glutamine amidotransferase [Amnibacterium sp.]
MKAIRIAHLFPREMNIYGDLGNVLALARRLEWRGYPAEVEPVHRGDRIPSGVDLVVGGGGQDSGQSTIEEDLTRLGPELRALAQDGLPMLVVCGLYQLFGHRFRTAEGRVLRGIGVLDVETVAGPERLIGNVVASSTEFGEVLGYENHSGRTTLGSGVRPLARVLQGAGNNGTDRTEGAVAGNVLGTYLHGSLLPRNPAIADHLLGIAVRRRHGDGQLAELDERLTDAARLVARSRPR